MSEYLVPTGARVRFEAERAAKADLFRGEKLFAGLNCFEPGQRQAIHTHAGAEKFYFLVSGKARLAVGDRELEAVAGDIIWAPAGVPHGVVTAHERTVMLVGMAPGPGGSSAAASGHQPA
jgi:quercetin dioxygenase-like cupin family protein